MRDATVTQEPGGFYVVRWSRDGQPKEKAFPKEAQARAFANWQDAQAEFVSLVRRFRYLAAPEEGKK